MCWKRRYAFAVQVSDTSPKDSFWRATMMSRIPVAGQPFFALANCLQNSTFAACKQMHFYE